MYSKDKLWTDQQSAEEVKIGRFLGKRCDGIVCPRCHEHSIRAVIIVRADDSPLIASTDDADPELWCSACGFWW